MRKISLAFGLIASLFATSAYADFTGKNAAGTTMTFKNAGDCTAVVCVPVFNPVDSTGANFGVTANPFFVTIGSGKIAAGAVSAGAYVSGSVLSGAFAGGAIVDLGAQADAACGTATGTCSLIALQKFRNQPATPTTPFAAAATDNHTVWKNGAGIAMSVHTSNNSATKNYLRLYDAGTGFNGCNSATGVIFAFEISPNDSGFTITLGGGAGIAFTNGLSVCVTSGFGLTDTTAATATAILVNASYK